ncbi:MAG: 2-C-methyl-D-erythritol 2,4-cyclodiphosphate synthase [Desulfobacterales bacterium]|nr:2-C-methyl-D-erythritol 2,4-cyclodiphosphate synthase [Desulfobacterales bacterium]
MRIGMGYDVHRLVAGRPLVLGGVTITHETGLMGHSDADVLVHAVCDALLGAAALGDIGTHFPDTDPVFKDISSLVLLEKIAAMVRAAGFTPVNLDATLIAERPKIQPHKNEMRENIARAAGMDPGRVNLKATTTEGLGAVGREEGIAAHCIALLEKQQ